MTELQELLTECKAHGIRLIPAGDANLTIDAPEGALTSDLTERLKAHKAELLVILQPGPSSIDPTGAAFSTNENTQKRSRYSQNSTKGPEIGSSENIESAFGAVSKLGRRDRSARSLPEMRQVGIVAIRDRRSIRPDPRHLAMRPVRSTYNGPASSGTGGPAEKTGPPPRDRNDLEDMKLVKDIVGGGHSTLR